MSAQRYQGRNRRREGYTPPEEVQRYVPPGARARTDRQERHGPEVPLQKKESMARREKRMDDDHRQLYRRRSPEPSRGKRSLETLLRTRRRRSDFSTGENANDDDRLTYELALELLQPEGEAPERDSRLLAWMEKFPSHELLFLSRCPQLRSSTKVRSVLYTIELRWSHEEDEDAIEEDWLTELTLLVMEWLKGCPVPQWLPQLKFPETLSKAQRRAVHQAAERHQIRSESSGIEGHRRIAVYLEDRGKSQPPTPGSLTRIEKEVQIIWDAIQDDGRECLLEFSRGGLKELIEKKLPLPPELQRAVDNYKRKKGIDRTFFQACRKGNLDEVSSLITAKRALLWAREESSGDMAVHLACKLQNPQLLQLLLAAGTDTKLCDRRLKKTPHEICVFKGFKEGLDLLCG